MTFTMQHLPVHVASLTPCSSRLGAVLPADPPLANVDHLCRLASVEVQSTMQFLPPRDILRLSRCCRQLHHDASGATAWQHARPMTVTVSGPDNSQLAARLVQNRVLTHAWFDLRWVGADAQTEANLQAIVQLPPRIRSLVIDFPTSDVISPTAASSNGVATPAASSSSPSRYTPDWNELLGSPSLSRVELLVLKGGLRGLATLLPRIGGEAGPLGRLQSLAHLDLFDLDLYGNPLRCLAGLPHLVSVRLTDSDWALQCLAFTRRTRLAVLADCPRLTELDVRRPVLAGPAFLTSVPSMASRLRQLTLREFAATGTLKVGQSHVGADVLERAYAQAFATFHALTTLGLIDVAEPDALLHGLASAPALQSLHIESHASHAPSAKAIGRLVRSARAAHSRLEQVHLVIKGQRRRADADSDSTTEGRSSSSHWRELQMIEQHQTDKFAFTFEYA